MKEEVKVCLIGSGRAGMIHGHNFAGRVPGGKIIAVCDPVGDVAENAAKENNVKLQIGFMRRFDESFQEAKKMIEEGEIGETII